ncbi:MAG: hypothetical protein JO280_09835 [Mycobacteriaceae bacterium]|nr:hypothetical protein [Mycobacteriaceae bacterium]
MTSIESSSRRSRAGGLSRTRIMSLCAAAAAAAAMAIVTVATSSDGAGQQSPVIVANHGGDNVTSGTVVPVGPAPHVVATSYAGQGWPGGDWFSQHKGA